MAFVEHLPSLSAHLNPVKGTVAKHHCDRATWKRIEPQILFLETENVCGLMNTEVHYIWHGYSSHRIDRRGPPRMADSFSILW